MGEFYLFFLLFFVLCFCFAVGCGVNASCFCVGILRQKKIPPSLSCVTMMRQKK